jgi:hypothetical protein
MRFFTFPVFTRINVALGVLAFSLAPLIFVAGKIRAGAMGAEQWVVVIAAVIALLAIPFTLFAACLFLVSSDPANRFHRLVDRFYEHRMHQ